MAQQQEGQDLIVGESEVEICSNERITVTNMTEIADGWDVVWQNAINIRKNKEENNYDQIVSHVEATSNAKLYSCATCTVRNKESRAKTIARGLLCRAREL